MTALRATAKEWVPPPFMTHAPNDGFSLGAGATPNGHPSPAPPPPPAHSTHHAAPYHYEAQPYFPRTPPIGATAVGAPPVGYSHPHQPQSSQHPTADEVDWLEEVVDGEETGGAAAAEENTIEGNDEAGGDGYGAPADDGNAYDETYEGNGEEYYGEPGDEDGAEGDGAWGAAMDPYAYHQMQLQHQYMQQHADMYSPDAQREFLETQLRLIQANPSMAPILDPNFVKIGGDAGLLMGPPPPAEQLGFPSAGGPNPMGRGGGALTRGRGGSGGNAGALVAVSGNGGLPPPPPPAYTEKHATVPPPGVPLPSIAVTSQDYSPIARAIRKERRARELAAVKANLESLSRTLLLSSSPFMPPLRAATKSSLPHIKIDQRYGKRGDPTTAYAQFIVAPVVPNYQPVHFHEVAQGDVSEFHAELGLILETFHDPVAVTIPFGPDWKHHALPYAFITVADYAKQVHYLCGTTVKPNCRAEPSYPDDVVKDITKLLFSIKDLSFLQSQSFVSACEKREKWHAFYDVITKLFRDVKNYQIQVRHLTSGAHSSYVIKTSERELARSRLPVRIAGREGVWELLPSAPVSPSDHPEPVVATAPPLSTTSSVGPVATRQMAADSSSAAGEGDGGMTTATVDADGGGNDEQPKKLTKKERKALAAAAAAAAASAGGGSTEGADPTTTSGDRSGSATLAAATAAVSTSPSPGSSTAPPTAPAVAPHPSSSVVSEPMLRTTAVCVGTMAATVVLLTVLRKVRGGAK